MTCGRRFNEPKEGKDGLPDMCRQRAPGTNYPLQISVNEGQPTTIRATVLQRIRSAARWAKIATTIADSGYVRIAAGFDSHRRLGLFNCMVWMTFSKGEPSEPFLRWSVFYEKPNCSPGLHQHPCEGVP
jgi:hypothetical protein